MFKIAVQTGGVEETYGVEQAYRMISEAGFDAVDANIDHLLPYHDIVNKRIPRCFLPGSGDLEIVEAVKPWGDAAKKYGLENYQAHAPFPSLLTSDVNDPEFDDLLIEVLRKSIIGAAAIGCHNLIIHPFFRDYEHRMKPGEEWEVNIDRYLRLAGTAREHGVVINLENMFTNYRGKIYGAICNDGVMAAKYVDALNDAAGAQCFGFCLDTGHALLASKDIRQFMNDLGSRITCFHVHDNDGVDDLHRAPYSGRL
ncbi:MAG: sugar phosphate isomerase/epimerase, partial [Lachnospiraceae bacterium]|nr:sugar phosphate isomerase/epimerase [Lachnospiraceae bacterium]